jgi:type IV pilus assembly protein PilM
MSRFSWSLREAALLHVAVEIAGHRVSAANVELRGGRYIVGAYATTMLPDGVVVPTLTGSNLANRSALLEAVKTVLTKVGSPRRIGLVVPDPVAKVSLVRFQQVPARVQDLDQLIQWQVRKTAPFPIEEAQISYVRGARLAEGQEFIVTLARRDVVAEYESVCADAGAYAGLVDLSTFNVVNTVLAGNGAPSGDWLLVNVAPEWASMAILRGTDLMFFRSRGADGEGTLPDLVHQTAMYYEDRLSGAGFSCVMLCGASSVGARQAADAEALRRSLEERLGSTVIPVDPGGAATLADGGAGSPALLDTLAPLVGMLVRDREAA